MNALQIWACFKCGATITHRDLASRPHTVCFCSMPEAVIQMNQVYPVFSVNKTNRPGREQAKEALDEIENAKLTCGQYLDTAGQRERLVAAECRALQQELKEIEESAKEYHESCVPLSTHLNLSDAFEKAEAEIVTLKASIADAYEDARSKQERMQRVIDGREADLKSARIEVWDAAANESFSRLPRNSWARELTAYFTKKAAELRK